MSTHALNVGSVLSAIIIIITYNFLLNLKNDIEITVSTGLNIKTYL